MSIFKRITNLARGKVKVWRKRPSEPLVPDEDLLPEPSPAARERAREDLRRHRVIRHAEEGVDESTPRPPEERPLGDDGLPLPKKRRL